MTKDDMQTLSVGIEEATKRLSHYLQFAKENDIEVTFEIQRKASVTIDVVEYIIPKKISQNTEITFEDDKPKGEW